MAQKYIMGHRAQNRSLVARYVIYVGILLVLASVLQVSFLSRYRIFGVVPDLMLCTVMCLGYFGGRQLGAICGIAAGVLVESMGSFGIVLLPIFYLFCGYLTGHYAHAIVPRRFTAFTAYFSVSLLLRSAVTLLYACLNYQSINLPVLLLRTLLPEFLLTAILGCALYFPFMLFYGFLEKEYRRKR